MKKLLIILFFLPVCCFCQTTKNVPDTTKWEVVNIPFTGKIDSVIVDTIYFPKTNRVMWYEITFLRRRFDFPTLDSCFKWAAKNPRLIDGKTFTLASGEKITFGDVEW